MHADELHTDVDLVRRLLRHQFPRWAQLPLEPVLPRGTDNALYRLGNDMVVRLARRERTAETLEKERGWLPRLAPLLPLAVPVPVADGVRTADYPLPWSVYTWLEGELAARDRIGDGRRAAADLAAFVAALQAIDASGGPPPGRHNFLRGAPLAARDAETRAAIAAVGDVVDPDVATALWEAALAAPEWDRPPVWIHGDLDARNLLVGGGTLVGVIDWGCLGVGDPACDAMAAWKVFDADARGVFRSSLRIDDATWERARGWALSQAVMALSYYTPRTNAVLVDEARRWLAELLADAP